MTKPPITLDDLTRAEMLHLLHRQSKPPTQADLLDARAMGLSDQIDAALIEYRRLSAIAKPLGEERDRLLMGYLNHGGEERDRAFIKANEAARIAQVASTRAWKRYLRLSRAWDAVFGKYQEARNND